MVMLRQSLVMLGFVVFLTGCGPSGPVMVDVQGSVTWNGAPLPQGDIIFEAVDGATVPSAGKVVNGEYKFKATVGSKLVRIMAMRDTGKFDPTMGTKVLEMYIPDRFNHETKLRADVASDGPNQFTFKLTEKD